MLTDNFTFDDLLEFILVEEWVKNLREVFLIWKDDSAAHNQKHKKLLEVFFIFFVNLQYIL